MSGLRITVSALLGAAGVMVAMASPAVAASAAPNITILSAGPDVNGDPYNLTVSADDGNGVQITTMTAHVFSASMADVADPAMTYVSGPADDQVWVASPPIPESTLPAGTYTVTVDVADGTESDAALPAPAPFTFAYAASNLTVTPAPPAVTQGSQNVTFSGTLTGTAPGGTPVGIANAPVNLSGAASNPVATTDSNGDFSYPATGVQPGTYTFSVGAVPGVYPAASDSVPVTANEAATSMAVAADPATVTEGAQAVTFTGSVSVTPPAPATQTPVGIGSGVPVYLDGSADPVTTTTDANGDFSYPATGVQPGTYTFSVNPSSSGLYSGATAIATVGAAAAPTTITVSPSPAVITFGSPDVTLSGTVTALPQGSTTPVPVSGEPVYLNGSASPVATTDSNGDFSYDATGITQSTTESFALNPSSAGLYSGDTEAVPVNVDPGTTAITASASPPDIDLASSTVDFAGTVSVTPFGSATPEGVGSGVPVDLSIGGGAASQVTTTDDASGDFTYTATGVKQAADYTFSVGAGTFYEAASESVPIGSDQVISTLTVTPSPASVTEGSQTVAFAGTLTGESPYGGPPIPIANAPVDLSIGTGPATQVKTTDANGDFTYTATGITQKTAYHFSVASSATYTAVPDNVTVAVDQAETRITGIRVRPAHLEYGQKATLTGTVQYLSGTTWTALAGTAVHLAEGKTSLRSVTTSSSGTFSETMPSTNGAGWTATVDSGNLILQTSTMGNLSIAVPMIVRSFSARLGVNGKISASGCLEVTAPVGYGPATSVNIQYATTARGRWRSLGTLPLHNLSGKGRSCPGADESYFSGAIQARLDNAYYRADFVATYSFQAAVSKVVHAWKYPTRIISFSVSPSRISKGGVDTIRGRLETLVKSWQPLAKQVIDIVYNFNGSSVWFPLGTTTTNSRGYFTVKGQSTGGNYVAINVAAYAGNATHLASRSSGVKVTVTESNSSAVSFPASSRPAPFDLSDLGHLQATGVPNVPAYLRWPPIASLLPGKAAQN